MRKRSGGLYHALVVLPDRLYPFKNEVAGQWVRGIRSYDAALERVQKLYGHGHFGFRLSVYRQLFHLTGSILFLYSAAYLSQYLFGSVVALYGFLLAAILFISFQEFYLQRKIYRQLWRKGIMDWLVWCVPIAVYILTRFY